MKKNWIAILAALVVTACGGGGGGAEGGDPSAGDEYTGAYGHELGYNNPENKVVLASRTFVLSPEQVRQSQVDRRNQKLMLPVNLGKVYEVGDVIVSEAADGLLIKISAVEKSSGDKNYIYSYEYASLTDAFNVFQVSFGADDFGKSEWVDEFLLEGVSTHNEMSSEEFREKYIDDANTGQVIASRALTVDYGSEGTGAYKSEKININIGKEFLGQDVDLKASFDVALNPYFSFDLDFLGRGPSLLIQGEVNPTITQNLRANSGGIDGEVSFSRPILNKITKHKFIAPAGIPIVYQYYLDIDYSLKLAVNAGMSLGNKVQGSVRAKGRFDTQSGFSGVFGSQGLRSEGLQLKDNSLGFQLETTLPTVAVGVMLYSTAGAHFKAENKILNSATYINNRNGIYLDHPYIAAGGKGEFNYVVGFKPSKEVKEGLEVIDSLMTEKEKSFVSNFFSIGKSIAQKMTASIVSDKVRSFISTVFDEGLSWMYFETKENWIGVPSLQIGPSERSIDFYLNKKFITNSLKSTDAIPYSSQDLQPGLYDLEAVLVHCEKNDEGECRQVQSYFKISISDSKRIGLYFKRDGRWVFSPGVVFSLSDFGESTLFKVLVVEDGESVPEFLNLPNDNVEMIPKF